MRAALVARDWAHATGRQLSAVVDRTPAENLAVVPRPCPVAPVDVVLLPGVYEPWRYLRPLATSLQRAGHPVHPVGELGFNRRALAASADVVERVLLERVLLERGPRRCVVVAHSKGGLIGLLAMARPTLAGRIAGVVAVASPFGGSSRGLRLAARTHLRELAPTASGLAALADVAEASHRVTSLMPAWDEMIPEGHALPGARNLPLPVSGHFLPLVDPGVWRVVHDEVDRWAATP